MGYLIQTGKWLCKNNGINITKQTCLIVCKTWKLADCTNCIFCMNIGYDRSLTIRPVCRQVWVQLSRSVKDVQYPLVWRLVENKVGWECIQSSFFCRTCTLTDTPTPHSNRECRCVWDSLPSSSSLLHLSYSNLKLIFSHSYLPKLTHISPPVSLHFLLSTTEKCDQWRYCFEIKYES